LLRYHLLLLLGFHHFKLNFFDLLSFAHHHLVLFLSQTIQLFLVHFLHICGLLGVGLVLFLMLLREFGFDNGKSQIQKEEGADEN
jgi:hypothetical protein